MKERIITAIGFVIVMVLGIFGGGYPFGLLFLLIGIVSFLEFFPLSRYTGSNDIRKIITILFGVSPILFAFANKQLDITSNWQPTHYAVLTIPFLYVLYLLELHYKNPDPIKNLGTAVLGYVFIGIPYALLIVLAFWQGIYNPFLVIGLLLLIWLNDTGAYFSGRFFGKHLIAPNISPKKTWEGFWGGVVATLLTSQLLAYFINDYSNQQWLIMGLICSFGILGDLIESLFKRKASIKDSGTLMPGHGGVLDRFDAFTFVIPAIFGYFYFLV